MSQQRSRVVTEGLGRTLHRWQSRATGIDDAAIARPFVAVIRGVDVDVQALGGWSGSPNAPAVTCAVSPTFSKF